VYTRALGRRRWRIDVISFLYTPSWANFHRPLRSDRIRIAFFRIRRWLLDRRRRRLFPRRTATHNRERTHTRLHIYTHLPTPTGARTHISTRENGCEFPLRKKNIYKKINTGTSLRLNESITRWFFSVR